MVRRGAFASRVMVLALAVVALGAGIASARMADDDIPGVALPSSPVRDSLTETTAVGPGNVPLWDIDDVYQVRLAYNERFEATLTPPPSADFDLYLFRPGWRRSVTDAATYITPDPLIRWSENPTGSVDSINYVSDRSTPATFYLDVAQQFEGSGPYVLAWRRTQLPTPEVASSAPASIRFGASADVTGTAYVAGRPMAGFVVEVKKRAYGTTSWTRAALATTAPDGSFSLPVKPVKRTEYRVHTRWSATAAGEAVGYGVGPVMTVWPRAYLTIKSPSVAKAGKPFTISGSFKPAHARGSGHVRVIASRQKGSEWVRYGSYSARHSSSGWSASVRLPKGTWQLRATVPTDALHAATVSSPRTVKVK